MEGHPCCVFEPKSLITIMYAADFKLKNALDEWVELGWGQRNESM